MIRIEIKSQNTSDKIYFDVEDEEIEDFTPFISQILDYNDIQIYAK